MTGVILVAKGKEVEKQPSYLDYQEIWYLQFFQFRLSLLHESSGWPGSLAGEVESSRGTMLPSSKSTLESLLGKH